MFGSGDVISWGSVVWRNRGTRDLTVVETMDLGTDQPSESVHGHSNAEPQMTNKFMPVPYLS